MGRKEANKERLAKMFAEKNKVDTIKNSKKLKMQKYHYFKNLKLGKHKKRIGELEMEKRDELLQELAGLGIKITVKKQYSVGYHPITMEIECEADGYEQALEFIDIELMRMADDLPLAKLTELSNQSKGEQGGSNYSKPKKTYAKKNYGGGGTKPQSGNKPEGAEGSDKQWKIILDSRNKEKLIDRGFLTPSGEPIFDVSDFNEIKKVVGVCFD